ncbi:MAG: Bug family tripartite tricarboxylate transporter substrate binding protein [Xanthobacteraceae bacterium]
MYRLFSCKNWAAIAIAICFGTFAAASQPYPERPATIVVGFSAGGVQDVAARFVAEKVSDLAGVRFLVENRPGAGGGLGIDRVATSQPDGYTIMLVPVDSLTVTSQILSFSRDPIADLLPIEVLYKFPGVLVVPKSSPANSVSQLVELAKKKPGGLNFASASPGSPQHLQGASLAKKSGTSMTHVAYKGGAPMMSDLLTGRIDFAFSTYSTVKGNLDDLKVLAVATPERLQVLPNVPTLSEQGFSGIDFETLVALMAPRGVPSPIVDRIRSLFLQAVADPDVVAKLAQIGVKVQLMGADELAVLLPKTRDNIHPLLKELGLLN